MAESRSLRRYESSVVAEVRYIPLEPEVAPLFLQIVSSRYEHASILLAPNLSFAR